MNDLIQHLNSSRRIGEVIQVSPSRVLVRFDPLTEQQSPCAVGEYLTVTVESFTLVGQLSELWNDRDLSAVVGYIDLFSTIIHSEARAIPGVLNPARVSDKVCQPSLDLIKFVITGESNLNEDGSASKNLSLSLAQLRSVGTVSVDVSPERLFGRHCAILGATGGGKSWSLARIVEEVSRHRSKAILIDATGEYEELEDHTIHVHFGNDTSVRKSSERVSVPYHHLNEQDLFAMFRPTGASQGPKLRAALKSLKLAQLSSSVTVDGTILKAHKSKHQYEKSLRKYKEKITAPYAFFDIRLLPQQIENECVEQQRSVTEPDVWGGTNSIDLGNCMSLITRVHDMIGSSYLEPIFKPRKDPSIFERLHSFIRSEESRIFRINMANLSFAFGTRKIVANALGRHLFELSQLGCFQKRPLLVVIDEAHQFLTHEDALEEDLTLNTFGLIAKEGRKYALTLCIATQRPRDIPEDILSQMGTLLVHRLINDNDRGIIERASGEVDDGSLSLIPSLAPGEGILTGVDFPVPLHVRMHAPQCRPRSAGANYQEFWSDDNYEN